VAIVPDFLKAHRGLRTKFVRPFIRDSVISLSP
jgi:hypothetical protein